MGNEESHQSAPRIPHVPIHATSAYTPPGGQQNAQDHQRRQTHAQTQPQPHAPGWVLPTGGGNNNGQAQNKVYPDLPPEHTTIQQTKYAQATMQQNPTAPSMFCPQPPVVSNVYFPQSPITPFGMNMNNDIWSKGNSIPSNAFRAGHDTDGTVIYICRALHEGDLLPGKLIPTHKSAYVPYCGEEIPIKVYETLIGNQYKWVPSSNGHVPAGAVEGGYTKNGEKLFIGRASHNHSMTPGKIHPSHNSLYIPYGGDELCFREYEVLVHSKY